MITGRCHCGSVNYEADGAPLIALLCHCRDCQRVSGTGHVPVMGVDKAKFKVSGEIRSYTYKGGSGRNAVRNFCAKCGSMMFGTPEVAPHLVTIYVGSLDDASMFKPAFAQFTRSRQAWDVTSEPVPAFETTPPR